MVRPILRGPILFISLLVVLRFTSGFNLPEAQQSDPDKLVFENSRVEFISAAPLETVKAVSTALRGIISRSNRTFAFSVTYTSFNGFNSPLQQEHFNENFMESDVYLKSTFKGKIIENVDWQTDGTYKVRVKGLLNIHGIEQERIIPATIEIKQGKLDVHAIFHVVIQDHNIVIPRILLNKIAEEVEVRVHAQSAIVP